MSKPNSAAPTPKQTVYLESLAASAGYVDGLAAVAANWGVSRSKAQAKHLTRSGVSATIDALTNGLRPAPTTTNDDAPADTREHLSGDDLTRNIVDMLLGRPHANAVEQARVVADELRHVPADHASEILTAIADRLDRERRPTPEEHEQRHEAAAGRVDREHQARVARGIGECWECGSHGPIGTTCTECHEGHFSA